MILSQITNSIKGVLAGMTSVQGQVLPDDTGGGGPQEVPCIALDTVNGGWNYSSPPDCQGRKV